MARNKSLSDHIKETEVLLAKYKLVHSKFPDARMCYYDPNRYASKSVNNEYTKLEFNPSHWSLTVSPYTELKFDNNGKEEIIRIDSLPRRNRLLNVGWRAGKDNKKTIKISRFIFNMKKNKFKEDLFNDCRAQVMEFIKNTPGHNLDDKHLEPRLKKLLMFI
jgi:hypothetical protein